MDSSRRKHLSAAFAYAAGILLSLPSLRNKEETAQQARDKPRGSTGFLDAGSGVERLLHFDRAKLGATSQSR
jgi:hypothetical protein